MPTCDSNLLHFFPDQLQPNTAYLYLGAVEKFYDFLGSEDKGAPVWCTFEQLQKLRKSVQKMRVFLSKMDRSRRPLRHAEVCNCCWQKLFDLSISEPTLFSFCIQPLAFLIWLNAALHMNIPKASSSETEGCAWTAVSLNSQACLQERCYSQLDG